MPEQVALMRPKVEIKTSTGEQFCCNLLATNGEVIFTGERYKDRRGVQTGIRSIKTNATMEVCFGTRVGKNGKHYSTLKAGAPGQTRRSPPQNGI